MIDIGEGNLAKSPLSIYEWPLEVSRDLEWAGKVAEEEGKNALLNYQARALQIDFRYKSLLLICPLTTHSYSTCIECCNNHYGHYGVIINR